MVSRIDIRNNVEENLVLNGILVAGYVTVILEDKTDYGQLGNVLGQFIKLLFFLPDDRIRSLEDNYSYAILQGYETAAGFRSEFPWLRVYDVIGDGFSEMIHRPFDLMYNRTEDVDTTRTTVLRACRLASFQVYQAIRYLYEIELISFEVNDVHARTVNCMNRLNSTVIT